MGAKTIPLSKWKRYLKSLGLKPIRTKSSHEIWDYSDTQKLLRPVTLDNNYKDVPITHIHTSLKTLNISKTDFEKAIKNF
ncbi:MAG: hypothetical protein KGZ42_13335 [Melioribacter sp.]|nr:hypothetical protein [Melioribacter sp.]